MLYFKITVFSLQCNTHNSTHCKFFIICINDGFWNWQKSEMLSTVFFVFSILGGIGFYSSMFFWFVSLGKFSVDFKAEVQEHLLHPLLSLHQIQVDGAWLHYQGYLRRRSCRLHYWKRFQISNCNNSYNCQATTTKNIFNHICTCIISRQRYIVGWFHTIFT